MALSLLLKNATIQGDSYEFAARLKKKLCDLVAARVADIAPLLMLKKDKC